MKSNTCSHLQNLKIVKSEKYECQECVKTGDEWVHLRTCQTCGTTLCCDSSVNKHARAHHNESDHSVIISAEPGEKWAFCYNDEQYLRYD